MKKIWTEQQVIQSYGVGANGKLSPSQIMRLLQEAASTHASHLNLGYHQLIKEDLFWVLSRLKVIILRPLKMGERITIRTWPRETIKLFSIRDFQFIDEKEQIVMQASSAWLMLNSGNLRPQRVGHFIDQSLYTGEEVAIPGLIEEVPVFESHSGPGKHEVGYSELDINQHVNNANYADWFINQFYQSTNNIPDIKSFTFNFNGEFKFGDTAQLKMNYQPQSKQVLFEGSHPDKRGSVKAIFYF